MKSIKVYKGMQFNGFDGYGYEVTKDVTIEVWTHDISEFMDKLKESGLKQIGESTNDLPDDMFLFRLAVVISDEDVIFTNGTFTWLDDVFNLATNKVQLADTTANSILTVLYKLCDVLNDDTWNKAREIAEVDMLSTVILDVAYDLYTDLVEKMLTV